MRRLALPLLAVWLVLAAAPALAAPERIAVVDMVELIEKHPRATDLQRKFEQRQSEAEDYARVENKALRELQAAIEMIARNNPQRRIKEKEFVTQQTMLKLELEWRQQEALREYMDGLEALYVEVQRYVSRYARENAIGLVLLKTPIELKAVDFNDYGAKVRLRAVVHHEETLDITQQIKALFMPAAPDPAPPAPPAGTAPPGR